MPELPNDYFKTIVLESKYMKQNKSHIFLPVKSKSISSLSPHQFGNTLAQNWKDSSLLES